MTDLGADDDMLKMSSLTYGAKCLHLRRNLADIHNIRSSINFSICFCHTDSERILLSLYIYMVVTLADKLWPMLKKKLFKLRKNIFALSIDGRFGLAVCSNGERDRLLQS